VLTVLGVLLALLVLVAGAGYGYAQYRYDQIPKVAVPAERPPSGPAFNMLVIGSDTRAGAKASTGVGTSTTVTGQRSDVLMVWHVVPASHQITILSIPRDTMAQMVGSNVGRFGRFNRINAAYNTGPNLLVQTVQDDLGIPISHVVEVDFAGFKGTVDALGGVYMDFRDPAKDAWSGLNMTRTGCQLLNGTAALAVARSRHYQYEQNGQWVATPISDLGRIKRQDSFLRSLVDAAKRTRDPLRLNAFLGSLHQGVTVDTGFSLGDLLRLAFDFRSVTPNSITAYTLPIVTVGAVTPWGDVLFVTASHAHALLAKIFGAELVRPSTPPPGPSLQPVTVLGAPLPPPSAQSAAGGAGVSTSSTAPNATPPYDPTPCSPG